MRDVNHYHLAVRMGEVSLSRSMRFIHHRFTQSYNGRHGLFGPFWQGRYRSKLVGDDEYLRQLIAYIHLNPVTAGVVKDAGRHRWCGHREVIGKAVGRRLVDVDETLLAFDSDRRRALVGYRSAMSTALGEDWGQEDPGRLPWWRAGRPPKSEGEREITVDASRPRIGVDGLSTAAVRPRMELGDFLEQVAEAVEIPLADLKEERRESIVEGREILAWLGVELYGFPVKVIAEALDKHLGTASRLVSRAAERRTEDEGFRAKIRRVDSIIATSNEDPT